MLALLKRSATTLALNTVTGVLGGIVALIGVGFLTAAFWLRLSVAYGPQIAGSAIGAIYLVVGCVVLALPRLRNGRGHAANAPQHTTPEPTPMQSLVVAFMQGLDAAILAKKGGGWR